MNKNSRVTWTILAYDSCLSDSTDNCAGKLLPLLTKIATSSGLNLTALPYI